MHGRLNVVQLRIERYFAVDVTLGVARRNNDGRHVLIVEMVEVKVFLDQTHVLVDAQRRVLILRMYLDVLLSDGFDEADLFEALLEPTDNGQRHCRLADVLSCRRYENGSLIASLHHHQEMPPL